MSKKVICNEENLEIFYDMTEEVVRGYAFGIAIKIYGSVKGAIDYLRSLNNEWDLLQSKVHSTNRFVIEVE